MALRGSRRGFGVLAVLVAVGCTGSPPAPSLPTGSIPPPAVTPAGTPSPSVDGQAVASPTPAPIRTTAPPRETPSPSPSAGGIETLAWHRLGTIPGPVRAVVGFRRGYVALSTNGRAVFTSTDGREWRRIRLPLDPPGPGPADPDSNGRIGRAMATNGEQVVVVGGYSHQPCASGPGEQGGDPACGYSPVAWSTSDGLRWRVSYPSVRLVEFVAVWSMPQGWEAAASSWSGAALGGRTLWHSADGLAWTRRASRPPAAWEGHDPDVPVGLSDTQGRTLLAASERGPEYRTTLGLRLPGEPWVVIDTFPGAGAQVVSALQSTDRRTGWMLGGFTYDESGCDPRFEGDLCGQSLPTIWTAVDATWSTVRLDVGVPIPGSDPEVTPLSVTTVTGIARSGEGYVAVGAAADGWLNARHETWISLDGVTWERLPQRDQQRLDFGPGIVAMGPAGVIGISKTRNEAESAAWELR
jgi:hypothetical protein